MRFPHMPHGRSSVDLTPTDLTRAACNMVAAALLFAAMGVLVKVAARDLPNSMVVFLRSVVSLLVLVPWLLLRRERVGLRTRNLKGHLLRGVFGSAAMYCFFFALSRLALAEALLLNYSLPLFLPLIERAWLGTPITRGVYAPLSIGLLGLLLILKPGTGIFEPAALVGALSALFAATAQVGVRDLTRTESVTSIVLYFSLISTLLFGLPAALEWRAFDPELWPALIALGVCATGGQFLMTRAYQYAPAAEVGPFIYTSVLFAGLFDWIAFSRLPDRFALMGACCIVAAGIAALRAGRRRSV